MKKVRLAVLAAVIAVLLCGCYDYSETNDLVYATALGIDVGTQNNYEITFQYARVFEINSGSESGESGAQILDTITVDAPTVYSAVTLANHMISKRFMLSHLKLTVISEKIARDGVSDLAEVMMRSDEIRPHIFMAVARGSAKEYLKSVKPSIDINPIKYYSLMYDSKFSAYIPKFDNIELCFYSDGSKRDIVLPVAAAVKADYPNDSTGTQNQSNTGTQNSADNFEYRLKNYLAGSFKKETANPSEIMGMAVFSDGRLAGFAESTETELYNILRGDFTMNRTTFRDSVSGEPVTVKLEQARKPKIRVDTSTAAPTADIRISLDAELLGMPSGYVYESDLARFESDICADITAAALRFLERMKTEYNSDVLGLGAFARRNFLTYADFENYNWKEKYKNTAFNVTVDFKVRRSGQIMKSEGDI